MSANYNYGHSLEFQYQTNRWENKTLKVIFNADCSVPNKQINKETGTSTVNVKTQQVISTNWAEELTQQPGQKIVGRQKNAKDQRDIAFYVYHF